MEKARDGRGRNSIRETPDQSGATMRRLEWLFPIHGYIRRRRNVSGPRVALTAGPALIVQWFSVHVFLAVDTSAHISLADKILWGLKSAILILKALRNAWRAVISDPLPVSRGACGSR